MFKIDAISAARMYLDQQHKQREQKRKEDKEKKSFEEELVQELIALVQEERSKNSSFQESK